MTPSISVLKFGSSVLTHPDCVTSVVHDVYREYRQRRRIVVVVSAIGRHTDSLLAEAHRLTANPSPEQAVASLLATGEKQSAALLTIALDRAGIPCRLVEPSLFGLKLEGKRLDGEPVSVDTQFLRNALADTPVIVVPGFIGVCPLGGVALMGRGGSDLSAVFLADKLDAAHCRLVKDVDAIYEFDPAAAEGTEAPPERFEVVTYEDALRVSDGLIQPKAIAYLREHRRQATVAALHHVDGTLIGASRSNLRNAQPRSPVRVLLLGLGNVGRGVFEHCRRMDRHVEVVGIGVRNRARATSDDLPQALVGDNIGELLARPYDVLIELTGDPAVADSAITQSLRQGRSVITANKEVLVRHLPRFTELAEASGATIAFSAAVGGGVPMLEALHEAKRQGSVCRIRGVLNGTTNLVLDSMSAGISMEMAVRRAKRAGCAEADPLDDLSGRDSENKLRLLAHLAFGFGERELSITRSGLTPGTVKYAMEDAGEGKKDVRLVASADAEGRGTIGLETLSSDDLLAGTVGEENRLLIGFDDGAEWLVKGRGAGRWPTAEAVMADLLQFHDQALAPALRSSVSAARQVERPWWA